MKLLFAQGNHICAVCVANSNCELQDLAKEQLQMKKQAIAPVMMGWLINH